MNRKTNRPDFSPRTKKKSRKSPIRRVLFFVLNTILTILLVGIITGVIVGSAFAIYVKNNIVTTVDESKYELNSTNTTTKLYYYEYTDRENRVGEAIELEDERLHGSENSIYVSYDQIPKDLLNAIIAIEDKRFWDHSGVDWYRTIGAGVNFIFPVKDNFGGSTITQQLIKNISGENDYKIQRKIQEIFWALDLEKKKSKEDIITLYLNVISLSQNCYGVQAAANTYFSKDVSELTLLESVCIAAITNNPSYYDPVRNPENNMKRRKNIFDEMYEQKKISKEEYDKYRNAEVELNLSKDVNQSNSINSWYTDMVIEDVINDLVEEKGYTEQAASLLVYSGGLKIYTCMDPEVQSVLEAAYLDDSNFPEHTSGMPAQSSMIVIDPYTGDVLGVAGAKGKKKGNRVQNYAMQTVRPAGSSIKPVSVYAPALESGLITYATVYDDTPFYFKSDNSPYPHNLPDTYRGLTNINSAIERSVNTIAMKVLDDLTLSASFDYCKNTVKMDSLIEILELSNGTRLTDMDYASLALGQMNYGITVREITAAYTPFVNDGIFNEARSYLEVRDSQNNVILSNKSRGTIVLSEENAAIMTKMLENVVDNGTARAITLKKQVDCAGKTGTTSNDYDRWYIGYTPYYIGGVWYGYEYPKSLASLKSNPCVTIWDNVMTILHEKYLTDDENGVSELQTFTMPDTVIKATYCMDSGKLMTDACRADLRGSRAETGYFAKGTQPKEFCDCHVLVDYDTSTKAVASKLCPSESVKKVGLITTPERSFPKEITVVDAEFVYRDLPDNVEPGGWWGEPFFANALSSYCGTSNVEKQSNRFCYEHFDFEAFDEGLITSWGKTKY